MCLLTKNPFSGVDPELYGRSKDNLIQYVSIILYVAYRGIGTVAAVAAMAATLFSQTRTVRGKGRQCHYILIITAHAHMQHSAFAAGGSRLEEVSVHI